MKIAQTGVGTSHWFIVNRQIRTHIPYKIDVVGTVTADIEVAMGQEDSTTPGKALTGKTAAEIGEIAVFPLFRVNVTAGTGTATLRLTAEGQDAGF